MVQMKYQKNEIKNMCIMYDVQEYVQEYKEKK